MKTLLLIDANSFIHRAYHALPPLKSPEGKPTGALYGLTNTLLKLIKEKHPEYIAACFDRPEPTFREKKYKEYKAHRPPAPDELIHQIIEARALMKILGIPIFEAPSYEADDLIGTLAEKYKKEDVRVLILTGDLDTLQLVEERVLVEIPRKGISDIVLYDKKAVEERFGVPPERITDYKGLVGDQSDNIPGVPGVGPKTAELLLKEFETIERLFAEMPETHKFAGKILPHKEKALLSKELATIDRNAPVEGTLKDIEYKEPDRDTMVSYLEGLGFESIIKRIHPGGVDKKTHREKPRLIKISKEENEAVLILGPEDCTPALLASKKLKVAYDWKNILKAKEKIEITPPIFDIKIAAWLLAPDARDFGIEAITKKFLGNESPSLTTETLRDLFITLERNIKKEKLEFVFTNIEMPLVPVLAEMERAGIGLNVKKMAALREKAKEELGLLEKRIYKEAGTEFNINSPKQMGEILFDKLGLKDSGKKTAGGQRSTREEILEEMRNTHPVVPLLLEYRETFKIESTYFAPLIEKGIKEGRIHTTYLQTGTATGRLSSEKPNLQNIPQESKWAIPLRNCFEARVGFSFLSADYSQLELRLLAHVSRDEGLERAFKEEKDIHTLTASKVFGIPEDDVDKERRRAGKTLNFGIVYGMGPRAFARATGFAPKEAAEFISAYFKNFPGIRVWQQETIEKTHELGFVENEHGRKRWFEHADASHPRYRAEIDRMATNMPIQSLGADALKLAMIRATGLLKQKNWGEGEAKLLLSIHDELLFEVADDILEEAGKEVKKIMEGV
ncbi:MAG: DNA polymerase, partial [Nanoarchaeota archaeon]|nr:DNA polymerase [Nanoarchaeota archaeon]